MIVAGRDMLTALPWQKPREDSSLAVPPLILEGGLFIGAFQSRPVTRPKTQKASLKGGDPAAGSPTATLLRLHPSR